jgi:hypothetical protein
LSPTGINIVTVLKKPGNALNLFRIEIQRRVVMGGDRKAARTDKWPEESLSDFQAERPRSEPPGSVDIRLVDEVYSVVKNIEGRQGCAIEAEEGKLDLLKSVDQNLIDGRSMREVHRERLGRGLQKVYLGLKVGGFLRPNA